MTTLALVDVRPKLLALLGPLDDSAPVVLDLPDAVHPPCYVLGYGSPWLEPLGQAGCNWRANVNVLCVAGRLEPGAGLDVLEDLTTTALRRLYTDRQTWPVTQVGVPERIEYANVSYMAALISLRPAVSIGGSPDGRNDD